MRSATRWPKTAVGVCWISLAIVSTIFVGIECFGLSYHLVRRTFSRADSVDIYVRMQMAKMPHDGYPESTDQSWFGAYWKEFNDSTYAAVDWAPYSNYHRRPFQGKYINVDRNGRRVTWNQDATAAPGSVRLAVFGGSTIWGTGARDEFTIPSYVAKLLAERYPHRFRVVNYGQDRYVSTQEVVALLREIQIDNVPEIIIFYDGYNDAFAATQAGAAGIPMNEDDRLREFNILHPSRSRHFYDEALSRTITFRLIRTLRAALWPEAVADSQQGKDTEALALDVVRVYSANIEFVSAIAEETGSVIQFYWQPTAYSKALLTEDEKSIVRSSEPFAAFYRGVQKAIRHDHRVLNRADFRDISKVLDAYDTTAFIDSHNVTERANEMIAGEIVKGLQDSLKQAFPFITP